MANVSERSSKSHTITNFLRYPGSKRQLLGFLSPFLPTSSNIEGCYYEPFIGGGAVFFFLQPKQAILSDINPDLMDLYRGIRQSPSLVWKRYCVFGNGKTDYERVRNQGAIGVLVDRAARVLFLNRTCFKGMWRHNQRGEFNVGYGGQERRWVIAEDNLVTVGRALRRAKLQCCDFEDALEECAASDFIFADPPYRPGECEQINDHYVGKQFTFEDHRRLAAALQRAKKRGAQWALTTSAHSDIVALFRGNHITVIPRGTGPRPGITVANTGEVLVTSYRPKGVQ